MSDCISDEALVLEEGDKMDVGVRGTSLASLEGLNARWGLGTKIGAVATSAAPFAS